MVRAVRKTIRMLVTVTVPADMTAAQARKEVRCLIGEQANWAADTDDIRVRAVRPIPSRESRKGATK